MFLGVWFLYDNLKDVYIITFKKLLYKSINWGIDGKWLCSDCGETIETDEDDHDGIIEG